MDILKGEQEFHNTEALMLGPALVYFILSRLQSSAISVLGCEFTDDGIWF